MGSDIRRKKILDILSESDKAVSASALAEILKVSRQIIVSDIALLRAKEYDIISTPRGYVINHAHTENDITFKIACMHSSDLVKQELYTIVDNGGKLVDVIVEHPIYGQLAGQLSIASRYDADEFLSKVNNKSINLLCLLTDGVHLHTVSCSDAETADRIRNALNNLKILLT